MKYNSLCQFRIRSCPNRIIITYGSIIIVFCRYFNILILLFLMCLIIVNFIFYEYELFLNGYCFILSDVL